MGEGSSGFKKGTGSVVSFRGLGRAVLTEAAGFRGREAVGALSWVCWSRRGADDGHSGWSGKVAARGALQVVVWKGNEWREGVSERGDAQYPERVCGQEELWGWAVWKRPSRFIFSVTE